MPKRSKLDIAIDTQASALDPAQREFVKKEYATYKWNAKKISELERQLSSGELGFDEENKLFKQRHQLVAEQSSLFSHIMRWLKGTAVEKSDLDSFLS